MAFGKLQWLRGTASSTDPQVGFDAGDGINYFNVPGSRTPSVLNLAYTTLNFTVGTIPQSVALLSGSASNIAGLAPLPAGVGQQVALVGSNLAGTSRLLANGADATASITNNTAGGLLFRVPPTASLMGLTSLTTTTGSAQTPGVVLLPEPGHALALDGADDYASVPHNAALNLTGALTVEAWLRTTVGTEQYAVTKGEDSWLLGVNGGGVAAGRASFYLKGPSNVAGWLHGTSTISDGHWHHVAGTYDGDTLRLYVDGVQESRRAASGPAATGTSPLLLGSRPGKPFWAGSLDEVRIWRSARSATELAADRYQMPRLPNANLVTYFNFDRGTPAGVNTAYPVFHDVVNGLVASTMNMSLLGASSNYVESYAMVMPSALAVTNLQTTGFTLQWQPSVRGSVMSYVVEVATSPTFATILRTTSVASTVNSAVISSLPANTTYYCRVRAERTAVTGQGSYASTNVTTPTTASSCGISVNSFTPSSGPVGTTVELICTGLTQAAGSTPSNVSGVRFGGVPATSFTVVSGTKLTAVVPAGAVSGAISVLTSCGNSVSTAQIFTPAAPTLTLVSPAAELPGQLVTLTGTNFAPASTVRFGNQTAAAVTYVSPTTLTAVVPVLLSGYGSATSIDVSTANGTTTTTPFTTLSVASPGVTNSCLTAPAVTNAADNGWHYVLNAEGQVVLAYNSQGRNLGTVATSYQQSSTGTQLDAANQPYLGRNWRLTTSTGPFTGSTVRLRFYGLAADFGQLQSIAPSRFAGLSSLRVLHYSGLAEDCQLTNNTTGTSVQLTPTTAYGPDGSNFFVSEVAVPDHFSEFYLGAVSQVPLPVELTAFTATPTPDQRAVRLAWTTASEQNSAFFEVERSLDGRSFAPIGTVAALGTSTATRAYQLLDSSLPTEPGTLFYRLRAVDRDASFRYSAVRVVALNGLARVSIHPNPAHRTATLTGAAAGVPVRVVDALGREVLRTTTDATGKAELRLPAAGGVYAVRAWQAPTLRLVVE